MSTPFLGMIVPFAGNFAPRGWFLCQGQLLPISQYQALFAILGTTYGGNGTQNFALPNLQGRTIVGQGTSQGVPFVLGQSAGSANVTLLTQNLPAHSHNVNAQAGNGSLGDPANALLAQIGTGKNATPFYSSAPASSPVTMNPGMIANTGGNIPISVQNPYLVINYIIAYEGIFPTRN